MTKQLRVTLGNKEAGARRRESLKLLAEELRLISPNHGEPSISAMMVKLADLATQDVQAVAAGLRSIGVQP